MELFVVETLDKRGEYLRRLLKDEGLGVAALEEYEGIESAVFLFSFKRKIDKKIASRIPEFSTVFCLKIEDEATKILKEKNVKVFNYFDDELLIVKNAYLTAEGALAEVILNTDMSLLDMSVLILGSGRVAKACAKVFKDMSAFVAIAARSKKNLGAILSDKKLSLKEMTAYFDEFDVIINTVPALVMPCKVLKKVSKDTFILDLASAPGGIDFEAAEKLYLKTKLYLGVPSIVSPHSAANEVKKSILRRI
ncbi:MAG: hypothetical protein FWE22_02925 [Firmicutes bacterium]|nr:hypothetical protein [Bacillota bacterium]